MQPFHLAFPVRDIDEARKFYTGWDLHQLHHCLHLVDQTRRDDLVDAAEILCWFGIVLWQSSWVLRRAFFKYLGWFQSLWPSDCIAFCWELQRTNICEPCGWWPSSNSPLWNRVDTGTVSWSGWKGKKCWNCLWSGAAHTICWSTRRTGKCHLKCCCLSRINQVLNVTTRNQAPSNRQARSYSCVESDVAVPIACSHWSLVCSYW